MILDEADNILETFVEVVIDNMSVIVQVLPLLDLFFCVRQPLLDNLGSFSPPFIESFL